MRQKGSNGFGGAEVLGVLPLRKLRVTARTGNSNGKKQRENSKATAENE
jgi:hypothetical protein